MEIERKFLINRFPEGPAMQTADVYQGYLCTHPVVRIRKTISQVGTAYVLCFKGEGTLQREEIELPIQEDVFEKLQSLIGKPLVHKEYRTYPLPQGYTLECSLVDSGSKQAFYYAEVEFPTLEEALRYCPDFSYLREVTEEPAFSMSRYWEETRENLPPKR
jgi:adenylate cyclase